MSLPEILHPTPAPLSRPFVKIIEQPTKAVRYRYRCEGRPGTIPGASSTADNKTPFSIQIGGYQGNVVILVSCVTSEQPYRPHPHNLVGLKCKKGVCYVETEVTENKCFIPFPKIAVQCVTKKEVAASLKVREEKNIDPFKTGFDHKQDVKSIALNVVRLCVQVFLVNENREHTAVLTPVVSDPIVNKKTIPDPIIFRLSHCNSYVDGRDEDIILLCTKITKENIRIRFFETRNNDLVWEDFATFHPNHVYNQTAICFRPPKYYNQHIQEPVKVNVQLVRLSDGFPSPMWEFEYLPLSAKPGFLKEKRQQYCGNPLFAQLVENSTNPSKIARMEENNPFLYSWTPEQNLLPQLPPFEVNTNQTPSTSRRSTQEDISNWIPPVDLLSEQNLLPQLPPFDQTPSTSRRSTQEDISNWRPPVDLLSEELPVPLNDLNQQSPSSSRRSTAEDVASLINVDNINGMPIFNMELEPIHISSGDLEMYDVNKLSGSLQEFAIS